MPEEWIISLFCRKKSTVIAKPEFVIIILQSAWVYHIKQQTSPNAFAKYFYNARNKFTVQQLFLFKLQLWSTALISETKKF